MNTIIEKPVKLIWAQNYERAIGKNGDIPWHLPEDLKRFQELTAGDTVIMGKNTWISLPTVAQPLKGRQNIVVSSSPDSFSHLGAECYSSLGEAINAAEKPIWVIGGASMYAEALQYASTVEITLVDVKVEAADTFAPKLPRAFVRRSVVPFENEWLLSKNGFRYRYETWQKVS